MAMSEETKQVVVISTALASVLCSLIWAIAWYHISEFSVPVSKGYTQKAVPYTYHKVWVKNEGESTQ